MIHGSKLVLVLAAAVTVGVSARAQDGEGGYAPYNACNHGLSFASASCVSDQSASTNHRKITRFATRMDGDHSLDTATVAEQVFGRYTLYKVHLHFASGAEQSIAVSAPPGGLQPEMRDMSGDNVPNDLVLNSSLLHEPLLVLINDGHDHVTVPTLPSSLGSEEGRATGPNQDTRLLARLSRGFRLFGLACASELNSAHPRVCYSVSVTASIKALDSYSHQAGRSPPAFLA